jgi:cobalt-zinc-cadmium efflux system protein
LNAAYLEVLTDSLASVAVLVAGLVMRPTGWYVLDPLVTTAIAFLVLPRTISLLRQSAHILLEGTPGEVDLTELRRQLLEIPGVEELHDLHLWTLTSGLHSLSVHIRATPESPRGEVLKEVQRVLREDAGVEHATVQVEWGSEVVCEVTHHA